MPGFSPKLPMTQDSIDGFSLTKSLKEVINQNLKMLLLTNPGERIHDPSFGVGIRTFLFQPNVPYTYSEIEKRTRKQVMYYMPHINITRIVFASEDDNDDLGENELNIRIEYFVRPTGTSDTLSLTLLNSSSEPGANEFGLNDLIT